MDGWGGWRVGRGWVCARCPTCSTPPPGPTTLRIFDSSGRSVRTLIDGELGATVHEVTWDGQNEDGQAVGSGVYVYRLETPSRVLSRKMVLTR